MKVKYLRAALEGFADDDNIALGEDISGCVPRISRICGKGMLYMAYCCSLPPGHTGRCYCRNKNVEFTPEDDEPDNQPTNGCPTAPTTPTNQ